MSNKKQKGEVSMDELMKLSTGVKGLHAAEEIISFKDYLDLVRSQPQVTRNTSQLMYDMILSSGVEHKVLPGKTPVHKYNYFEDTGLVGSSQVVYGQQEAKENLVERINNAARGNQASKRLWVLLGPPGSAKSLSMNGIKEALKRYSSSDAGRTYTVLLPTTDKRLANQAVMEEDGVFYILAPIYERPLQIVPESLRPEFERVLNSQVNQANIQEFLDKNPQYDGHYDVKISGKISPKADYILNDFMREKGLDFAGLMDYVKVKRMIFDADAKVGIGSYTPRDEKSQEAGSLLGNIDYSLLSQFGYESHPLVHDYKGELCVGANGFVEIPEILKLSEKFLYDLLFATQDRFFKPEGQPPVPFNGVIIGHTNFHEYEQFVSNRSFEALNSRTIFIEMPFSLNFKEELKIYEHNYSNESRGWNKVRRNIAHISPHTLEMVSIAATMTRFYKSKKNSNLSLLQKALIHANRSDSGVNNQMAKTILEEYNFYKPAEGTFGIDPRFVQNVVEVAEHHQITEFTANLEEMKRIDGNGETRKSMTAALTLQNPCVTPLDIYVRLEHMIKDLFASNKTKLVEYNQSVLPDAKEWVLKQICGDVYEAILKDGSVIEGTWKKYTDHVVAYAQRGKVKHEITNDDIDPDESFMGSVEKYLGVPDRDIFRKELSDAIGALSAAEILRNEVTYQDAIKSYIFKNEFRSKENTKLLGWVKAGASAADSNSKEQEQLNDAVRYLIEKKGYCGKCAFQALQVAANTQSIN